MQEDDENVEVWYLMAVAFNSLLPPDYESARCVLGMMITVVVRVVSNVYPREVREQCQRNVGSGLTLFPTSRLST